MEQELSNCPSADGTFLSSTFPNTHSLAAIKLKMVKQIISYLILVVLIITSCNNSNRQVNTLQKNGVPDSILNDNSIYNINQDTIKYDNSIFPVDSFFSIKVLTVGNFHSDEVWKNANKEKWLGLFRNKTGFYVAESKLIINRVHDEIVDDNELDKTGWEIKTFNDDTCLILMSPNPFVKEKAIEHLILPKNQVYPGDTVTFQFLGLEYKLFATGGKKKAQEDPSAFEVWNYKLYLTTTIKGQQHKSLLVAQPNFEEQMITIIFSGDIDGDGILDLIIDTSRHYDAESPTIYLSKPANSEDVVKPVGGHTTVGC